MIMIRKHILIIVSIIFFICMGDLIYFKGKSSEQSVEEKNNIENTLNNKIENIKEDLGYNNIDNEIYEIKEEYDGREVITIKPSLQYKVAMAGAIKNKKPEFPEIDKMMEQMPNKSGIWITKDSREYFLNILNKVSTVKYNIDNNGYLTQENLENTNEIDEKIKKVISEKKICAIDIDKITYIVDEITGTIEEYPFEELDPELPYEYFETENASLYIISPNTYGKLDYKYVLEEVFN